LSKRRELCNVLLPELAVLKAHLSSGSCNIGHLCNVLLSKLAVLKAELSYPLTCRYSPALLIFKGLLRRLSGLLIPLRT
jgi:uncharacterized membrane protein YqaE (UPF0057 family)